MPVYVASIDVRPLAGAKLDAKGATVDVFIAARLAEEAVRKLLEALAEDDYVLIAIDGLREFDDIEWNTSADSDEAAQLKAEAAKQDDVVYSVFYAWEDEYEH